MSRLAAVLAGFAVTMLSMSNVTAQSTPATASQTSRTLAEFLKRAEDYAGLHRRIVEKVGALDPTKSPKEIAMREQALGDALRAARPGAKQGDIFIPAVAIVFRKMITNDFALRSKAAIANREDAQEEVPNFTPMVNQIYPTTFPLATFPPGVLRQLPELPKPLEYRFVRRFLILRDSEANLIVDVLPDAAPPENVPPAEKPKK